MHNNGDALPTTDLYTQKWLRWYILRFMFFTTILKNLLNTLKKVNANFSQTRILIRGFGRVGEGLCSELLVGRPRLTEAFPSSVPGFQGHLDVHIQP